jgi:hypothetical protein
MPSMQSARGHRSNQMSHFIVEPSIPFAMFLFLFVVPIFLAQIKCANELLICPSPHDVIFYSYPSDYHPGICICICIYMH